MKTFVLTREFQHISHDEMDTCANYARLNDDNAKPQVEVQTLYRYGKPAYRTMSIETFNALMSNGKL